VSDEPRIPPLPPEEWEGDIKKILEVVPPGLEGRLGDNNIFPTFARHPELFRAWLPFGGIDGLVMNVGIGAGLGLAGTSTEDWDRVMAVNARSHFLGCKLGMQSMDEGAAIVLVDSIASREVMPFPVYAASKAALEALCRQAAVEGAPRIRVNLLHPGLIDTPLGRLASSISAARERVKIPAGRQGTAWEIAYAALFLLSSESSYVTGQSLIVDGGLTTAPRA